MGLVSNRAGGGSWVTNLQALLRLSRYRPWAHLPEDISLLATIFLPPRKGARFVLPACLFSSCRVERALGIKGLAWWTERRSYSISDSSNWTASISFWRYHPWRTTIQRTNWLSSSGCCYGVCDTGFSAAALKWVEGYPQTSLARMSLKDKIICSELRFTNSHFYRCESVSICWGPDTEN